MSARSWRFALAGALLAVCTIPVSAARWGPHGHSEITYDAASGSLYGFNLPPDIAKVMALGSIAPDYFEFDVPAAHAQVDDNALKIGPQGLLTSEDDYRKLEAKSYEDASKWHELYFNAAVTAAKRGDRERAAFLLGYAIHNMEDFGTHQGMANLVHATLDDYQVSPDTASPDVTRRLALSHVGASLDIARFRELVGPEKWRLFRGESVQRSSGVTIEPAALTTFGHDLDKWDPRSGYLPPSADVTWLNSPARREFDIAFRGVAGFFGYKPEDVTGHEQFRLGVPGPQIYNFSEGLYMHQDQMLALLDLSKLDIYRGPDYPMAPGPKNTVLIAKFFFDAFTFAVTDPKRFKALSARDRALLESTNWLDLEQGHQRMVRARLDSETKELSGKLVTEYMYRIGVLGQLMNSDKQTLQWIQKWRKILQQMNARWDREARFIGGLQPPTVDGRPPPPRFYHDAPDPPDHSDSDRGSGRSIDRDPPERRERRDPDCEPGPGGMTWCRQ